MYTIPTSMPTSMPAAAMSTTMPPTTTPIVIKPTSPHVMKMKSNVTYKSMNKDSSPMNYTISIVVLLILIMFLLGFMFIPKKK